MYGQHGTSHSSTCMHLEIHSSGNYSTW